MATARGEHEAPHRPCLQKQSRQKRTHRQLKLRIRLQRHQSPLPRSIGLSRVPTRSMRSRGLPFVLWQVALGSRAAGRIESFLAGSDKLLERDADAKSPSSKTRFATADESETHRQKATPRTISPDAARTLETPYTGSSSRPLQSPFGPYPSLAAAAATSRNFGGGSAETRSDQLTFA